MTIRACGYLIESPNQFQYLYLNYVMEKGIQDKKYLKNKLKKAEEARRPKKKRTSSKTEEKL